MTGTLYVYARNRPTGVDEVTITLEFYDEDDALQLTTTTGVVVPSDAFWGAL